MINLMSEYDLCLSDIDVLFTVLKVLNGGLELKYSLLEYPKILDVNRLDCLHDIFVTNDLSIRQIQSEVEVSSQMIKVSKSESLLEISFVYVSEAIQNEHIRGFRGGFSIPLWQKRNTIKAAKISLDLNMAQQDYALQRREAGWDQQFELYKSKSKRLNSLGKLLDKTTPHKSLLKAFELGEISLRTYITESVFYY